MQAILKAILACMQHAILWFALGKINGSFFAQPDCRDGEAFKWLYSLTLAIPLSSVFFRETFKQTDFQNHAKCQQSIRNILNHCDPSFPGSFSGTLTFQRELKTLKNINVPLKMLQAILSEIPGYLQSAMRIRKFERRHYFVHGFRSLFEADLAEFEKFEGYRYLLVVIDVYTLFLWTYPLRDKTSQTVIQHMQTVFNSVGKPNTVNSDAGGEFLGMKAFFLQQDVYFHIKTPPLKCAYVENAILHIKRKMYLWMRINESKNWPSIVDTVTEAMNNTHRQSLGNLRSSDLVGKEKAVKLDMARGLPDEPTVSDFTKNQAHFESTTNIRKGNFVYIPTLTTRGFQPQVRWDTCFWACTFKTQTKLWVSVWKT